MGREVRRVPANWEHPKNQQDHYDPLMENYAEAAADFKELVSTDGLQSAMDEWGYEPDKSDYMPDWTDDEKTHFMMYEDTSEGTPISPAFETPEELAKWLTVTGASAFADNKGTYGGWLRVARGGFAMSMVITNGKMVNGVDAFNEDEK